jgi:Phospholipase_D-nuclease N-terminal
VRTVHLDTGILLAIIPLVLIDLGMVIYCIIDLFKPERQVRGNNKLVWLLIILLVSTLGWLIYLLAGREE